MAADNGHPAGVTQPDVLSTDRTMEVPPMPEPQSAPIPPSVKRNRSVSKRTRFEVFKRDDFTCRYCGRKSPDVVLQIDHIVPCSDGGTDDELNLATSCWECNSGKSDVPLRRMIVPEDPSDKAIQLLETERSLKEYNAVLKRQLEQRLSDANDALGFWCEQTGRTGVPQDQFNWIVCTLRYLPVVAIQEAMLTAIANGATNDLRYTMKVVKNLRMDGGANLQAWAYVDAETGLVLTSQHQSSIGTYRIQPDVFCESLEDALGYMPSDGSVRTMRVEIRPVFSLAEVK